MIFKYHIFVISAYEYLRKEREMIVIEDLREVTAKQMERTMSGVFACVVDKGAPDTVRATLSDEATILYKAIGTFVVIEYDNKEFQLLLKDFATMEIL